MKTIHYTHSLDGMRPGQLAGLHEGWPRPPSPETHLESLRAMNAVVLAIDPAADQVVGFICGMTDGVLVLYVWDLEVRRGYQGRGIEEELLRRLLEKHGRLYQVNAHPSAERVALFAKAGFVPYRPDQAVAMTRMRMDQQDGRRKTNVE
jgi:ribosomal protein S18 acetylase RimI-like enzyme